MASPQVAARVAPPATLSIVDHGKFGPVDAEITMLWWAGGFCPAVVSSWEAS